MEKAARAEASILPIIETRHARWLVANDGPLAYVI